MTRFTKSLECIFYTQVNPEYVYHFSPTSAQGTTRTREYHKLFDMLHYLLFVINILIHK